MVSKNLIITLFCVMIFSYFLYPGISLAAENPDITAGLDQVDAKSLADKFILIAVGVGALSGAVAAGMLIYLGFKLKTGNERSRSDTKEHIMYVFIGLGVTGLAVMIVGFAAFLIKGASV
ncbi:hypothetical protein SAMN05660649_04832 [Desulfotomaculum arcticum]|uniref:Uncharacterized protein n=1 Tax=Desulfotruncus arcticus DSM 17038 TaxID=1121424 RepID=A0A1I2ZBF9_9FIRM|nr:hypothetical protein [Desulfotruncus arcticus]SFH34431.1 hypothetical protein SAMN05660649_04832 [Desulfotomaculum arcticum] [Desulfotruncus arcticus DSM 17038]